MKYLTGWTSGIFLWLLILQWLPITGVFMMMLGAPLWAGYFVHLIPISLFFDILIRKGSKLFLIVPILPYIIYFCFYFSDVMNVERLEGQYRKNNPTVVIEFDSKNNALVAQGNMVATYKIPVSYSTSGTSVSKYISYRLVTSDLCELVKSPKDHIFARVVKRNVQNDAKKKSFNNICILQMPDYPAKPIISVDEDYKLVKHKNIHETIYSFYAEGKMIGQYTQASYKALPKFPSLITSCGLISNAPEWKCSFGVGRKSIELNTYPDIMQETPKGSEIIGHLLGLKKYEDNELEEFQNFEETEYLFDSKIWHLPGEKE